MSNFINIVITGHVDHGKSTLIGRLLYDTRSMPDDRIRDLLKQSPEFAFFLDSFRQERKRNMTIDTTQYCLSSCSGRKYLLIDSPGHKEYMRNALTGAAYADAGIIVIDIKEGIREQTRRHAHALKLLGITRVIAVFNKMDLVSYGREPYMELAARTSELFLRSGLQSAGFIPISASKGENITRRSEKLGWYKQESLLEAMDKLKRISRRMDKLILPVQDVFLRDRKRVISGRIESGMLYKGQQILVLPRGRPGRVKKIFDYPREIEQARHGESIGAIISCSGVLKRGEVICSLFKPLLPASRIRAKFLVLSDLLQTRSKYVLKCGCQKADVSIAGLERVVDSSSLKAISRIDHTLRYLDMAEGVLVPESKIFLEKFSRIPAMGRFVISDKHNHIKACGVVEESNNAL